MLDPMDRAVDVSEEPHRFRRDLLVEVHDDGGLISHATTLPSGADIEPGPLSGLAWAPEYF